MKPTVSLSNTQPVEFSELSSYACFFRDRSTTYSLKKVVVSFYSPSEITQAKKCLVAAFKHKLSDSHLIAERRSSTSRMAHEAEVDDIFMIFDVLDNEDLSKNISFCPLELNRLPGLYGPEDININAVLDRQIHTEALVSDLVSAVASATPKDSGAIQAATDMIHSLEDRLNNMASSMTSQLAHHSVVCMW